MELQQLKKDELCCLAKNIGLKGARLCNKSNLINDIQSKYTMYRTIDNGGVPFEVYISEDQITDPKNGLNGLIHLSLTVKSELSP
jgi:hypothetical protein